MYTYLYKLASLINTVYVDVWPYYTIIITIHTSGIKEKHIHVLIRNIGVSSTIEPYCWTQLYICLCKPGSTYRTHITFSIVILCEVFRDTPIDIYCDEHTLMYSVNEET